MLVLPSQKRDRAVFATAKPPDDVEIYAMEAGRVVKTWLETAGLTVVNAKTEATLITTPKQTV